MENSELFENFLNNIISISIDENEVDLKTSKIEIKLYENTSKQLITKYKNRLNLWINCQKPKVNKPFKIVYKCLSCNALNEINSYKKFLAKLNGEHLQYCVHCFQKFDVNNMKDVRSKALTGVPKGTKFKQEKYKNELKFDDLSDQQKNEFWMNHYTDEEWKDFIEKFEVVKINEFDINEVVYIPIDKCSNQKMFTSKIKVGENVFNIKEVWCRCKQCGNFYKIHWKKIDISNKKNTCICRNCGRTSYLTNSTWKIRSTKNINGDSILYQSSYEMDFIKWCNENNILIQNGPSIDYFWNQKNRKYYVDFYIPKLNFLIELKDLHKFHKDEVNSGQWDAKENAAEKLVNERNI